MIKNQIWHKKQKIEDFSDYIELEMFVDNYEEIIGKILRYGEFAEAVSPHNFREMWRDKIIVMYNKYIST